MAGSETFLLTAFDCPESKMLEWPESFLQVVAQGLLFTDFDCPRSKIYEGESFLGLSQSFLFRAFCIKSSGTDEIAESLLHLQMVLNITMTSTDYVAFHLVF